jgi:hypothetical protein
MSQAKITGRRHMATSSTTIPVDGRTNKTLSLPFKAGKNAAVHDEPPAANVKTTATGRVQFQCRKTELSFM